MLELLVLAVVGVLVVALGREPAQSLVVDVDSQRVYTEERHVDPEVELEVVDEERVADVVADDERGVLLEFGEDGGETGGDRDALALRAVVRLGDVGGAGRAGHLVL